MSGTFGLSEDHHHARIPAHRIAEANHRIDVWALLRSGGLTEGASTRLQWPGKGCVCEAEAGRVLIDGTEVELTWDAPAPGIDRVWWVCPSCSARCRYLVLRETIGCRRCFRLDNASRHLHRTVGIHRAVRWRKLLGLSPQPFTAIPERPKHHTRYHRIVARILAEEARLLDHLSGVVDDLTHRRP